MYRLSDKPAAIREVQKFLFLIREKVEPKIPRVSIDGIYGIETRDAVKEFQKIYGIEESGKVNKETFDLLFLIYNTAITELNEIDFLISEEGFPVKRGDQNSDVAVINHALRQLRETFPDITRADKSDYFSLSGENAVKELQSIFGEKQSGRVDAALLKRFNKEITASHNLKKEF